MLKSWLKKLLPAQVLGWYHKILVHLAATWYRHPSRHLIVIGVTGTKGKSTTANVLWHVLTAAGHTVGLTGTANYRIGAQNMLSPYKMTMLGRFALQRYLAQMRAAGCDIAIVETTSEGIKQYRHLGIAYDIGVLTNLTPEHIEAHGGFEHYKAAKLALFRRISQLPEKRLNGLRAPRFVVVNSDDQHWSDFVQAAAGVRALRVGTTAAADVRWELLDETLQHTRIRLQSGEDSVTAAVALLGRWNGANAAVAAAIAIGLGVPLAVVARGLDAAEPVPGRMEFITAGQQFTAIVDYAYEPVSLRALYTFCRQAAGPDARLITLISSTGGGRDVGRRAPNGQVAATLCDYVIVTDEDPYDDDPQTIIDQVAAGVAAAGNVEGQNFWRILDRRAAIAKAVSLARPGDVVLVTCKGSEQKMMVGATKSIPWDDRIELRKAIESIVGN